MASVEAVGVREFTSVGEMRAHYAKIRHKFFPPPPLTVAFPALKKPVPAQVPVITTMGGPVIAHFMLLPNFGDSLFSQISGHVKGKNIIRATAEYYAINVNDMVSAIRTMDLVRARQVAAYVMAHTTVLSAAEIGRQLGHRDHSTVIHGNTRVASLLAAGHPSTCQAVATLMAMFKVNKLTEKRHVQHRPQ